MAREASFPVRDETAGLLRRERMTHHAGNLFHAHAMDLPILMASKTRLFIRTEGVNRPLVAILAYNFLNVQMQRMARRPRHVRGPLGSLIPVARHTGLPRRRFPVRFRCLAFGREYELDEQPVLFDDTELVTALTDDKSMSALFPG